MKNRIKIKFYFQFIIVAFCATIIIVSCKKEEFKIDSNTEDIFHVKNGDYLIPVLVRGNTASKKILLYIQGGPGYASLDYAKIDYPGWKETLEKEYAVAYYDQRGTGNKQGNFTQGESPMATWVEDLHKVAAFLEKAYDAEIIMLGHSYGGGLMYRYMIAKGDAGIPTKYISSDSPITDDSDSDTLRWVFRRAFLYNTAHLEISRGTNVSKWNEVLAWLSITPEIKKIEGAEPYKLMNQWNAYVDNLIYSNFPERPVKIKDYLKVIFLSATNPFPSFLSGKYKDKLVISILREEEEIKLDLTQIKNQAILIMTGRYDDICPPEELTYAFSQITSPQKKIKIIDYAGHEPFINQPAVFFNEIKQFIQE